MATFKINKSFDISKFGLLERYNEDSLKLSSKGFSGVLDGYKVSFQGSGFELFYDSRYGDQGLRGWVSSITIEKGGKVAAAITGLKFNILTMDDAGYSMGKTAAMKIVFGASDKIIGSAGADVLNGHAGNDSISGGAGNDRLVGGDGADRLTGGAGADQLSGQEGADHFIFTKTSDSRHGARDVIIGFEARDTIDLRQIDANTGRKGDQAFTFIGEKGYSEKAGELRYKDGLLLGDVNGDRKTDFAVAFKGGADPIASDFLL